ncbi:isoaspartyl peptidase/L-asparaginase [Pandoraea nosoerga]|uniref:Isoaspartyl peptidase n=1 Tax=Pandoraea nosoerga TaxID=2508296 RepID=A0A5E4XUI3_9BURK|nr:isoaspartyl peptidase/L-asparaginase [Pandoraea nosoerga]MBN4667520.1 isoaspartyl peptidase/L-asparaginase [Pandoraea nosoerga]MBN4674850.1 isoaspartyl peptidase/L-asparaginase [Pandoraea nosoerga]MBN4680166.1 isoaspartyl peptidase/L-asparaginase [Pandoraea nosoerga]MBN4744600.1 isoaspartyl peptidase/L-asparaginase [Pandoraea nosoerga]VVE40111.1 isoaspartyl peptidase [Pandoraea nosoerga]
MSHAQRAVIAIHGGAGTISRDTSPEEVKAYHEALADVLRAGQAVLAAGGSALDAVTEAVRHLEDCPRFNAGRGAVFTHEGTHELDAAIMDGATLDAGAIACVHRVRNPILAARAVLERSPHVLLVGEGAEAFAAAHGAALVDPAYFYTQARYAQWQRALSEAAVALDHDFPLKKAPIDPDTKFGTVGAVACDVGGHVAAATSTGGMTNKAVGRVGDSPLIGAGCYANDATAAVSATGTGEAFIRTVACYEVGALMAYAGLSLADAAERVIRERLPRVQGRGGLIAVDAQGNVALPFNTEGMYRGVARVGETPVTAIHE